MAGDADVNFEMVAERLAMVRDRIASAGAAPGSVTVVAVTKGFGSEAVAAQPSRAGLIDIGENYAQEMLRKVEGAPPGVRWHFLGELQRNKLARLAPHVYLWHGLDTRRAPMRWPSDLRVPPCSSRSGWLTTVIATVCRLSQVPALVKRRRTLACRSEA